MGEDMKWICKAVEHSLGVVFFLSVALLFVGGYGCIWLDDPVFMKIFMTGWLTIFLVIFVGACYVRAVDKWGHHWNG